MKSPDRCEVVAGVLVGGRSTRMGRDKAGIAHPQGGTLVEHVVAVARRVASDVVLLGSSTTLPATLRHLRVLADAEANGGPLAGLCSALTQFPSGWLLLLSCDLPLLREGVLLRLLAARSEAVDAVAMIHKSHPLTYHTCCAVYHARVLPAARRELTGGRRSLQTVLRSVRVAAIAADADEARQLTNVNTPADLARLEQLVRSRPADSAPFPS